jgi:SAM-dependent methyltransferase
MTNWSRGYPVHEPYPPSWHYFQSPAHLRAICALMGVAWDVGPNTPLSIAEVGSGTGYTSCMLGAGNPSWQVLGLDYNPAHIAEARSMAAAAGLDNVNFWEADLAELDDAALARYPEFDLINVHGVWSWVGDPVREGILRLIRRRLRPGGLALVSYNALPGAGNALGLARLVRTELLNAKDTARGIDAAATWVKRLIDCEAVHLGKSSWRSLLTGEIGGARSGYLLHEFATEFWRPCFFADVSAALATARCEFVGSATMDENFPQMSLSAAQRELWDDAPDEASRQLVLDFCVPRSFRRDLYVRGVRPVQRDAAVDALWLIEASSELGELAIAAQAGVAKLPAQIVGPVRAALASGPKTIRALRGLPECEHVTAGELLAILIGSGCAAPLWCAIGEGANWALATTRARRLNTVAAERIAPHGIGRGSFGLASPALGGGLQASAMELAVARAIAQTEIDDSGLDLLDQLVRRMLPAGPPTPPAEVIAELTRVVGEVLRDRLPIWRALSVL